MPGRNSAVNQTGTPSSVSDRSPHLSSIPCPLSQLLRLRADVSRKPTSQPSKNWGEEKKRGPLSSLGHEARPSNASSSSSSPATEIRFSLFRDRDVHWFSPADRDGRSVYCNRLPLSPSSFDSPSLSLPRTKKFHAVETWFPSSENHRRGFIRIQIFRSNLSKILNCLNFVMNFGIVIFWIYIKDKFIKLRFQYICIWIFEFTRLI